MHLAVVGAGALGRVYGVRLARETQVGVTFVVRPSRLAERGAFVIQRVDDEGREDRLAAPVRTAEVPAHADVVMVCVRVEQLDDRLMETLGHDEGPPIVMLTPMMPQDYERLRARFGTRIVAAMPGVVSYMNSMGVVRYWLPRLAPTLLDEAAGGAPAVLVDLARSLGVAGMRARLVMGVHESNPATTVTFIPLTMALDAAGGIDALLGDKGLLDVALAAAAEGQALARKIGKVAAWATVLTRFLGHRTLKIGVGLARHHSPEGVSYVEEHFGRKLHAQNVVMARAIVELAAAKGTPHEALDELSARLERVA